MKFKKSNQTTLATLLFSIIAVATTACNQSDTMSESAPVKQETTENTANVEAKATMTDTSTTDKAKQNTKESATSKATAETSVIVYFTQPVIEAGRYHKPYVAIWLEADNKQAIRTLSLWYQQDDHGREYLQDLKTWWNQTGKNQTASQIDGYSGATRVPKRHTITWDGKDQNGEKVAEGNYWLNIEVAREDGGRETMRKAITLGQAGTITDKGQSEIGDVEIHWQ